MTTPTLGEQPLVALVDDDTHSARLLVRTLAGLGTGCVKWYGGARRGLRLLTTAFESATARHPVLVLVDLKSSSSATADFVAALAGVLPVEVPILALAPTLERQSREALIAAGAAAVFERHADLKAYQQEIVGIAGFLQRHMQTLAAADRRAGGRGGGWRSYFPITGAA